MPYTKTIIHFEKCNGEYPEKPVGEKPQHIMEIEIDRNEIVRQCTDCGAFVIEDKIDE